MLHPLSLFQNSVLQDTVRRECEERFELTAALGRARDQVLELRRLSGTLPGSPRSLPPGDLRLSALRAARGPGSGRHPGATSGSLGAIPAKARAAPPGNQPKGTPAHHSYPFKSS